MKVNVERSHISSRKFNELSRKSIKIVFTPQGGILGGQKSKGREMS